MHLELPIVSFLCTVLSLTPLPWHWRAGTVPTVSISLWLFVSNFGNGINTTIWAGNTDITAVVWCDIITKINMGANFALPVSIFCLCLHLERVSSIRHVSTNISQKRRRQLIDGFMCLGLPAIYMGLHYVVQGHRFDIIEDFGCRPTTYVSVASIFIIWVPPVLFSLGAFAVSGLAFRNFWTRRISFARHLQSNSALTPSRYFRLMAMSLVQMFWGLGVIAFNMWFTMRSGLRPWISWEDVHVNFSRIAIFPSIFIPKQALLFTFMAWWTVPISTFIFFAFFSFGQDAMKEYHACYLWLTKVFRVRLPITKSPMEFLPSYVNKGDATSLSSLKKNSDTEFDPSASGITISFSAPSTHKNYQWNPPPSPSTTLSTCFTPTEATDSPISKEFESSSIDTRTLFSTYSTSAPCFNLSHETPRAS